MVENYQLDHVLEHGGDLLPSAEEGFVVGGIPVAVLQWGILLVEKRGISLGAEADGGRGRRRGPPVAETSA